MKFFTKEWYLNLVSSLVCFDLKKSERASKADQKYYNSLYMSQEKWYLRHKKSASRHENIKFDIEQAKLEFGKQIEENLDFLKANLPSSLWESMPDERFLALGVADYTTVDAITRYCGELSRKCDKVQKEYESNCESVAESIGWYAINSLEKLVNARICSIDVSQDIITLKTSPENTGIACKVVFSGAKKTSSDNLLSAYVLYPELLSEGEKYVLNLLCEGENKALIEFSAEFDTIEIEEI